MVNVYPLSLSAEQWSIVGLDDSTGPAVDTLCGDVLWVDRLHGLSTACHALDGLTYQPLELEQQHGFDFCWS